MSVQDERVLHFKTPEDMVKVLESKGRPLNTFKKGDTIEVWNKMKKGQSQKLAEAPNSNFAADFKPDLSPGEMLRLGVFEGKYLNDCVLEFPAEWFITAIALDKLRPGGADVSVNLFKIHSRQPLQVWHENGWIPHKGSKAKQQAGLSDPKINPDERGWFQWQCRQWIGRRSPEIDAIQIKRQNAFRRHAGAIKTNCKPGDFECRPRQRQALLQWAHNPFF